MSDLGICHGGLPQASVGQEALMDALAGFAIAHTLTGARQGSPEDCRPGPASKCALHDSL